LAILCLAVFLVRP